VRCSIDGVTLTLLLTRTPLVMFILGGLRPSADGSNGIIIIIIFMMMTVSCCCCRSSSPLLLLLLDRCGGLLDFAAALAAII
jgi:hypothetical protein